MLDTYGILRPINEDHTILYSKTIFDSVSQSLIAVEVLHIDEDQASITAYDDDGEFIDVGSLEVWLDRLQNGFYRMDSINLYKATKDYIHNSPDGMAWILAYAVYHLIQEQQGKLFFWSTGYQKLMAFTSALEFETNHEPYDVELLLHAMFGKPTFGKLYIIKKLMPDLFLFYLGGFLEDGDLHMAVESWPEFKALIQTEDPQNLKSLVRKYKQDLEVNRSPIKNKAYELLQDIVGE